MVFFKLKLKGIWMHDIGPLYHIIVLVYNIYSYFSCTHVLTTLSVLH